MSNEYRVSKPMDGLNSLFASYNLVDYLSATNDYLNDHTNIDSDF
jgi:hypothetical protein